jgi:cyclohexanone monooxygenase
MTPDVHTLIVGAGFFGIGTAIELDRAGLSDYLIVEAGDAVGGTWYWNTYPGIGVDIPSFSYQFSYEQNPGWSRTYAPGRELQSYAEHCVNKYGLRRRIRLNTSVVGAKFNEADDTWLVELDSGEQISARFLVNATGGMNTPNVPDIDGLDSFTGPQMHTARWDHEIDLSDKRVGIIGTGASAVQVIAEITPTLRELKVFQRTPIWCFPKLDVPLPKPVRWATRIPGGKTVLRLISQTYVEMLFPVLAHYFTLLPIGKRADKIALSYMNRQVHDPELRDKLTPRYAVGCKRPAFHNTYLSTFNRDNVELVNDRIERVTPSGVVAGGEVRDLDVLILATGFKSQGVHWASYPVLGTNGQSFAEFFRTNRQQAYEGISVPGFPNFFMTLGPYGYVGSSYFALIEAQSHHIVRCLKHARSQGATRIEVRQEANDRFFAEMMGKRHRQIFWQDSCQVANSYYFDAQGDVIARPGTTIGTYWRSRRFPLSDYSFTQSTTQRELSIRR